MFKRNQSSFNGPVRSTRRKTNRTDKRRANYSEFTTEYWPSNEKDRTFYKIQEYCIKNKCIFVDKEFPAGPSVLESLNSNKIIWRRPQNFCPNPEFFVDGVSRFDVIQGAIGDCWLLAAIESLSQNRLLFNQVVPEDQDYHNGYCGAFCFNFWRYGDWIEIVVDDYLPTVNSKLVFMQSKSLNEFWSALLEKAYAKLMGGYDLLVGGNTIEAMTDMTGGISENILINSVGTDFFQFLMVSMERGSLCGCAVDPNVYNYMEEKLSCGLMVSHAYCITGVKMLTTKIGTKALLIRIMNPWGEVEWKGNWSDNSNAWNMISPDEKARHGIEFAEDGEFWMAYDDWRRQFSRVQICHLGPDSISDEDSTKISRKTWNATIEHKSWIKRVNAGGCRNYPNTFWTNPQYYVTLTEPDDPNVNYSTLIVSLIQKYDRKTSSSLLNIGYSIYKISENMVDHIIPREFFMKTSSVTSTTFVNRREISGRHKLEIGHYVIIPSTFEPNLSGRFVLRIFSVKKASHRELDVNTRIRPAIKISKNRELSRSNALKNAFMSFAGPDEVVDSFELQKIINLLFKDINKCEVSLETSRSIIASCDDNGNGSLEFEEFLRMWNYISDWRAIFCKYDVDGSNSLDSSEFRIALRTAGFDLSNILISNIIIRYSKRDGKIDFSDFILCMCRLVRLNDLFNKFHKDGIPNFTIDDFMAICTSF